MAGLVPLKVSGQTRMIADIEEGTTSSGPQWMTPITDELIFFEATEGDQASETSATDDAR